MSGNPLRTALSTLGIVIGVAAVIATLALTDGLEQYARAEIEATTDVQSITISSRTVDVREGFAFPVKGYPIFGPAEAVDLARQLPAGAEVTMTASGSAIVTSAAAAPHVCTVTAALANYLVFGRKDLFAGRFFTDGESSRGAPIVVLSYLLARELSPNGDPASMLDRVVRVRGRPLTVIGVMPTYTGERGFQVIVPVRAAQPILATSQALTPSLIVRAPAIERVEETKGFAEEWLATHYRGWRDRVSVISNVGRLEQAQTALTVLRLVMGALAGISLIVGGVGIMNVLLASVAERTREIGVRKALGARQRDILYQFLAESVAIASLGSGVGTLLGFTGAFGFAAVMRWMVPGEEIHAAVTMGTLLIALLSAGIVGLTFGTLPALRAARLSPIDAIRHD